jgi:flavin reductase (DIM6/NTAB) family NADH-FMN oxidoreductase RutF
MPDPQTFRQAWGRFATGVSIVTTIQPDGQVHGMAANGIASVSLDPMLVLVCVGNDRSSHPLIKQTGRFAISILREDQRDVADYYARPPEMKTERRELEFAFTKQGSAIVRDSVAIMDCHTVDEYVAGDHTIFIGEVDELATSPGRPLLFFEGRYRTLD